MVHIYISADLPIRVQALPYADRVEIRFGKAFPAALIVDRAALPRLGEAITQGQAELDAAAERRTGQE